MDEDVQLTRPVPSTALPGANPMASMLQSLFADLDKRIEERWTAGNLSHGFWRTGAIPALTPVDTLREYGFWQGKAVLEKGLSGQVSVALVGGHTRIGMFLPNRLLEGMSTWGESLADAVAKAHDGQPASIMRRVGGDTLFDRIFTEAPFSAEWLLRCTEDGNARDILVNHLAWRVIDLWESALRTVMSQQSHDLGIVLHSAMPLPPIVTESLPITLQDVYEVLPGHWVTIVTQTASAGEIGLCELETQLQTLLPDHGVTVQKDAECLPQE
ncbi:hypothetical protein [Acidithiobacillus sp.]|uniref:hypothetical protein n=1 Tax=Acidithiobacillus sp. TaxID=1872118 RepID=UPI0025BD31F3|nr:hypothetical protein [Acidithiobacillus sp.]